MPEFIGNWSGSTWTFDLDRVLGSPGGFGAVYEGRGQESPPAAIKVITLSGDSHVRLQRREIEIADRLQNLVSEHLVRILDVGSQAPNVFVVMERADRSLKEHLEGLGPFSESEGLAVIEDIARGLMELHQLGIIHRDLKPGNVLQVGSVWKLSDFGIAHDSEVGTQTITFAGWGTYPYMAPEVWQLRPASPKADLYSLGCVAFDVFAGAPPFSGPTMEDFRRQHEQEQPPNLPVESAALKEVVIRLLSKDPAARHQDVRAVVERLQVLATPLSSGQEALRRARLEHVLERAQEESEFAVMAAEGERSRAMRVQAEADLREVVNDGFGLVQQAIPDAEFRRVRHGFQIWDSEAWLTIEQWINAPRMDNNDPLIMAGTISASNRRIETTVCLGNVVAEVADGRIIWNLYRFERMALITPQQYELGPPDRKHGFAESVFAAERPHMLSSGQHIWTKEKDRLTASGMVELYEEALSLRP